MSETPLPRTLAVSLVLVLSAATARATVWTVSPPGGGGQFTNIQSAINAASPGDTVLVMAGSYAPFTLNKGLRVLGVGPPLVLVSTSASPPTIVLVTGIPSGATAVLAGMKIQHVTSPNPCFLPPPTVALSVAFSPGHVALSNLQVDSGHVAHGIQVGGSGGVILDHVSVAGQPIPNGTLFSNLTCPKRSLWASSTNVSFNSGSLQGNTSGTALRFEGTASLLLGRSSVAGGDGTTVSCDPVFPSLITVYGLPGGNGLEALAGAQVRIAGGGPGVVRGGDGANGYGPFFLGCCAGGNGGTGLSSSASTATIAQDVSVLGGSPGSASTCPGSPGAATTGPGGTFLGTRLPSLGVSTPLASPGSSVTLDIKGPPLHLYAVGVATAPAFAVIPGVGGRLLLDPASLIVYAAGALDASGAASHPGSIPPDPALSTLVVFLQAATVDPGTGAIEASPAAILTIL